MNDRQARKSRRELWRNLHSRHPGFRIAVAEDARVTAHNRGERHEFRNGWDTTVQVLRMMWVSDAFAAHVLYRLRARLMARRIPILPDLIHHLCMVLADLSIGKPVLLHPGIYIAHGQTVIDGLVEIQTGCVITPWTSIGLKAGNVQGPTIGRDVFVGTGARILGPYRIGDGASIGANAVITADVEPGTTVVGVPARVVGRK